MAERAGAPPTTVLAVPGLQTTLADDEYRLEAEQYFAELEAAGSKLPGVMDVLSIMDQYERAGQGADQYAAVVEQAVFFSSTSTSRTSTSRD